MGARELAWAATALCVAAVLALLVAERRASVRGRYLAKPLAALGFLGVGLAAAAHGAQPYPALVIVGLILGAAGDIGLMLPGRRAFQVGTALFLAGHLAYIAAGLQLGGPARWLGLHAVVALALGVVVLRLLWPHLGPSAPAPRGLVVAYVVIIMTMALAATTPVVAGARDDRSLLLAVGAIAFLLSDLAVARHRFVSPGFWNKAWGQPAYFAAQLLIA
jgi:uncharacterized membrane protein YhhN